MAYGYPQYPQQYPQQNVQMPQYQQHIVRPVASVEEARGFRPIFRAL